MNWMLVLLMGIGPHYQIVKTDLVLRVSEFLCKRS